MKITINRADTKKATPVSSVETLKSGVVTGEDVHILAGRPSVLKTGGKDVPNNNKPYKVAEGQVFMAIMH